MIQANISYIAEVLLSRGLRFQDIALASAGILAAWHENRSHGDVRSLMYQLALRLQGQPNHDGLTAAAEWLEEPGLPSMQLEALEAGLDRLRNLNPGPIDWTAELAACLGQDRRMQFGAHFSLPVARAITRVMDIPISDSCVCLFDSSTTLAWTLSGERPVTLFASEQYHAVVVALFARAACRSLTIDIRNPISGTYTPAHSMRDEPDQDPPFAKADHIISAPPFGARVANGAHKGVPFEAYQVDKLIERAARSFSTIVPDGMLFRESKFEVDLRHRLVERYSPTVMSLPPGMFASAASLMTSLVRLEPQSSNAARLIDGRSMENTSSGRASEGLIVRHLDQFHGLRPRDDNRSTVISAAELSTANYSLLPDRYLQSDELAQVENAIADRPQVTLEDVASIERSKAPMPMRDPVEEPPITALEIMPSDVVDGVVRRPKKKQAFEESQEAAVARVTVQHGDILVSIKGNVGIIGIVRVDAYLDELFHEPWIISQSLATIRWRPNPHIPSAEVLNALLTAPWVREKLESMSGGGTVRTLPMNALRSLRLPVPTAEECAEAKSELKRFDELRKDIETLTENLAQAKLGLWHQLWNLPPEIGED